MTEHHRRIHPVLVLTLLTLGGRTWFDSSRTAAGGANSHRPNRAEDLEDLLKLQVGNIWTQLGGIQLHCLVGFGRRLTFPT